MPINVYLREAVNDTKTAPNKIISLIKKQLQTCRLTKFNSQGECAKFYSSFFLQRVEGVDTDITITDWGIIYNTLLCDNTFFENMILYIAMYQHDHNVHGEEIYTALKLKPDKVWRRFRSA